MALPKNYSIWLTVDYWGIEKAFWNKPRRCEKHGEWWGDNMALPKGSIKKLIGRELSWSDEPVELKEEQLMYRPITMYQIVCDRCGEVFGGTDTCSALFSNKEVDIGDYSDWEMIDGKHYCPDCYDVEVINGVYNVKAKEKQLWHIVFVIFVITRISVKTIERQLFVLILKWRNSYGKIQSR